MSTLVFIRYIVWYYIPSVIICCLLLGICDMPFINHKHLAQGNAPNITLLTNPTFVNFLQMKGLRDTTIRKLFEVEINSIETLQLLDEDNAEDLTATTEQYHIMLNILSEMQTRQKERYLPHCKPEISEGSHSKLEIDGYTFFECDISACDSVSKIKYEKSVTNEPNWVAVFEGNETFYHALDTGDQYTLENRTEYAPFSTQHTLSINPLSLDDEGKWRCVVYDEYGSRTESNIMELYLAPTCKPEITEGRYSKLNINGHASFECDISTCGGCNKVRFEKKISDTDNTWTPVFESNKTSHRALNIKDHDYTLQNRNSYANFTTRHILYINPLKLKDQGKWRCVALDMNKKRAESDAEALNFVTTQTDTRKPSIWAVVGNHSLKFICEVNNLQYEPTVAWTLNGTDHVGEVSSFLSESGRWFMRTVIHFPFNQSGKSIIGCEISSSWNSNKWSRGTITIDVEDSLIEYPLTQPTTHFFDVTKGSVMIFGSIVVLAVAIISMVICRPK